MKLLIYYLKYNALITEEDKILSRYVSNDIVPIIKEYTAQFKLTYLKSFDTKYNVGCGRLCVFDENVAIIDRKNYVHT